MFIKPRPSMRPNLRVGARSPWPIVVLLAILVGACSSPGSSASPSAATLKVVTTTTVFEDIVKHVGGDRVVVKSIIGPGVGPEDYEPKPDDAKALDGADLIVSNGVGLDDFLDGLITANGSDSPRLILGDGIPTITVDGEENPHFWLDPSLVVANYLPAIQAKLTEIDAAGSGTYEANAKAYGDTLTAMDSELATKVQTIAETNRKLVTFHDAFPYFAKHYGLEVVGVILENPGQEPSAAELAALVETVKSAGVKAVFSESQFSPELAETLATEAGITNVVTALYNDALGPSPADSYEGLMRWNVDQIVNALK